MMEEVSEDMLNLAVEYVIAELPFFIGAPDILEVEETLLAYHRPWKLGEKISNHEFSFCMRPNQGYLIVQEWRRCFLRNGSHLKDDRGSKT